jgi:hypothetical protein
VVYKEAGSGIEDQRPASLGPEMGGPAARRRVGVIDLTDRVIGHFLLMVAFSYSK